MFNRLFDFFGNIMLILSQGLASTAAGGEVDRTELAPAIVPAENEAAIRALVERSRR